MRRTKPSTSILSGFATGLWYTLFLAGATVSGLALAQQNSQPDNVLNSETSHESSVNGIRVPLVDQPYRVDGVLDEPFWSQAAQVPLPIEVEPGINQPARQETTAYVVDTGHSLLVAFDARDTQPEQIRARLRDRDALFEDDFVGIIVDTYNDNLRALEFFVNPLGAQADLIRDDSNGGEDSSWDAIWNSAGKITQQGYVVEMEIPYTELQMPATRGEKTWGITFLRIYPRSLRYQFMDKPLDRDNSCFLCQSRRFSGFANAQRGRDLEITPSMTLKATQQRPALDADYDGVDTQFEPSLDVNWGISPNLTLNATLNPDFSQVETDSAQLNVNETFALFFPEKRPFFLENADYFNTRLNLIHTRTIADPDYGLRLVGKNGNNAWGTFLTNDNFTTILLPGTFGSDLISLDRESLDFAARFRYDLADSSTIGGLLTHRSAAGYRNSVFSADSRYRLSDSLTVSGQLARSVTQNPPEISSESGQPETMTGNALYAAFQHSTQAWNNRFTVRDFDASFRADLGFINQVGYRKTTFDNRHSWFGKPDGWWHRINAFADWDYSQTEDHRLLENEITSGVFVNARKQSHAGMFFNHRKRLWNDRYYRLGSIGFESGIRPSASWRLGLGLRHGDAIDFANNAPGKQDNINLRLATDLGIHFNGSLNHSFQRLQRHGQNVFIANQTDVRLSWQFYIRQRLRVALIQTRLNRNPAMYGEAVDKHSRSLDTQVIYSYKINPKTLVYLGYSDASQATDAMPGLTRTGRTLFAKFSYAWKS
jgi:hypothetical protein